VIVCERRRGGEDVPWPLGLLPPPSQTRANGVEGDAAMRWLDAQPPGSMVYVVLPCWGARRPCPWSRCTSWASALRLAAGACRDVGCIDEATLQALVYAEARKAASAAQQQARCPVCLSDCGHLFHHACSTAEGSVGEPERALASVQRAPWWELDRRGYGVRRGGPHVACDTSKYRSTAISETRDGQAHTSGDLTMKSGWS
jgi:hypothetical protein